MMFPTFRHQKTDMLASGAFERAVTFSSPGPTGVRTWATILQSRIAVHDNPLGSTAGMEKLQLGEQNVILLAETAQAEIVLLDEKAARRFAADRGLRVTGTLGVLGEAATRGLVDLTNAIERLRKTNFRYSPALLKATLDRFGSK